MTLSSVCKSNEIVDGVLRYPPTGLKVVIVGGGVAGLLTALECWRKGHQVQVLEKRSGIDQTGDVVGIGPSAWSTLNKYPTMLQEYDKIAYGARWRFCREDGTSVAPVIDYEYNRENAAQHAAFPLHIKSVLVRWQLINMLADQCRRFGISLKFGVNITSYREDDDRFTAMAISESGSEFFGDVVIAADGITTKSHGMVLGKPVRAKSTGFVCFRAVVPTSCLAKASTVQKVLRTMTTPEVRLYASPTGRHHAVTVCPDFISLILGVEDDGTGVESWSASVNSDYVLSTLGDLRAVDPLILEVVNNVPGGKFVRWLLAMRDPQPIWTSKGGRVIQVGDSAHSFLPSSGNGACMAMESAISIAECLRLGGKNGVHIATKVHELLRFERVSIVQHTGTVNRREFRSEITDDVLRQGKWIWTHNPEAYATENFTKARSHLENREAFKNTNIPPGYVYRPWTIDEELDKQKKGTFEQDLKTNGDWAWT